MEEFVFVEPLEIDLEKAQYLVLHYRYLVVAERKDWDKIKNKLENSDKIGGVYYTMLRKLSRAPNLTYLVDTNMIRN